MSIKNIFCGLLTVLLLSISWLAQAEDVRLYVRHEVSYYAAWKKSYDAFSDGQKKGGVFFKAVYQSVDDANDVTVIHDFHSLEKAKAFANSDLLKNAMKQSGVIGVPQIWYTKKGDK
jgi:hypothetical protein